MRKLLLIVPLLAVGVVAAKRDGLLEPTNICQTSPHHLEPALRTRRFPISTETLRALALEVLASQTTYGRAWKVVETQPKIHAEVPVFLFTDDLVVTLMQQKHAARLDVRSASRVGRGDFGENRRHVLQFLRALDNRYQAISGVVKKTGN